MGDLAAYRNALAEIQDAQNYLATFNFVENSTGDAQAEAQQKKSNRGRQATVEITYTSTGSGQRRNKSPLIFPVLFRTEPHLTTGCATIKNPEPKIWHDPIGHCGVYAWKRDGKGYYLGAWIWTRVEVYPLDDTTFDPPPASMSTQHYLTFSAEGLKDPAADGAKLKTIKARTVGLK